VFALAGILEAGFGKCRVARDVARALGGHHGRFAHDVIDDLRAGSGGGAWITARKDAAEALRQAFEVEWSELRSRGYAMTDAGLMVLAGLTTVADWIGSDRTYFPFTNGDGADLSAYLAARRPLACKALDAGGFRAIAPTPPMSFQDAFKFPPNEMQRACTKIAANANGPALILIEAPMGGGKTEAALYAAAEFQRICRHRGIYFALPTQATSNQMLERMIKYLHAIHPEANDNLILLHGLATLNETFERPAFEYVHNLTRGRCDL